MDIEIEKFRNKHDNDSEWDLKKVFLQAHKNSLPIEQIECLTNCYANVKLYGCKYPDSVMEKLISLEASMLHHENISNKYLKIKNKSVIDNKHQKLSSNQKIIKKIEKLNEQKPKEVLDIEEKFKKLRQRVHLNRLKYSYKMSQIDLLTQACNKTRMPISVLYNQDLGTFICTVLIDDVFISTGKGNNKKFSKLVAFVEAVTLIQMKFHNFVMFNSKYKLIASDHEIQYLDLQENNSKTNSLNLINSKTCNKYNIIKKHLLTKNFLSEFVIRELELNNYVTPVNYVAQLDFSASFNHVETKYNITENKDGCCICVLTLDGIKMAEVIHKDKKIAKAEAALKVMNFLKKRCYTIIFKKNMYSESGDTVIRNHLLSNNFKNNEIPASNVGNQLLRKLGWSGGGVGKSEGISEPVFLKAVYNREGFGLGSEHKLDPNFVTKVTSLIVEYMSSDKQDDLVFSPEFTKEERNVIHLTAKKYYLISKSYGLDNERFLILKRKRTPMELIKHIEANNGETHKYLLIPPSSN